MRIVFMGTPVAAVPTLERIVSDGHEIVAVYCQPDRPAGRGNKISVPAVKQFATANNLPVRQPKKLRTSEAVDEFRGFGADTAVVVAYGRILPGGFLEAFPKGAINVHFSLLPKYRGAAPVNWAIVQGESKTGVTTMQMDEGLDTGPILLQSETLIAPNESSGELTERLAHMGAELLSQTLADYESIVPTPQDETRSSLAPILKKEHGLISWMLDANDITNRVRGFQPFPTAFTYFRGKKLTVWKCEPILAHDHLRPIGEIVEALGDILRVFCGGDSMLQIHELQLEGKRRMSSRDFINGMQPRIGEILGV